MTPGAWDVATGILAAGVLSVACAVVVGLLAVLVGTVRAHL
jgi:hypothetical protein